MAFSNRKEWLAYIRTLASQKLKEKRKKKIDSIIQRVKQEVKSWKELDILEVQKIILVFLYWAEGQKLPERGAPLKFANTDPRLIRLFVGLLERCYHIDRKKLKITLYLHWYHNEKKVKTFWKNLLNIDEDQFRKIYRKKRNETKRFRKNFMGICFVTYQSVDLRQEIVQTAYTAGEYLLSNLKYAPVA